MFQKKFLSVLAFSFFLSACSHQSSSRIPTMELATTQSSPVAPPLSGQNKTASEAGRYLNYSPEALVQAAQGGGKVILFFHAAWCPTCQAAEKDITTRSSEIPTDLTILKVNYDTESELKKKYGITYQHTFVQVDAQGNEQVKWNGGELDEIINRTK